MIRPSPYFENRMANKNDICLMQVAFVDIVSYSKRQPYRQLTVIHAFMSCLEKALAETARQFIDHFHMNDINLVRDVVVLPSGDGAALGFPFEGIHDTHLSFARHLLRIVDEANRVFNCDSFFKEGWCDCHDAFSLRCGISEGKLILYKDLNKNYNIAGDAINMAARVMGLANGGQIFSTYEAHLELTKFVPDIGKQFRKYEAVRIKHNLQVHVYQYTNGSQSGIDVSYRADLDSPAGQQKLSNDGKTTAVPADDIKSNLVLSVAKRPTVITQANAANPSSTAVEEMSGRLVLIPAGEFSMGTSQTGQALMKISHPFLMDKYPITQTMYEGIMKNNPSRFIGTDHPVDSVSWHNAVTFCNKLSHLSGLEPVYHATGHEVEVDLSKEGYRLPTETEWEYACLGGGLEDGHGAIDSAAWYNKNSDGRTHPVGKKSPNAFGLYDMMGNVWEWCNDWYQKKYPTTPQLDYIGPPSGFERVIRGGSWSDLPDSITSRSRYRKTPGSCESTLGFRVVRRPRG